MPTDFFTKHSRQASFLQELLIKLTIIEDEEQFPLQIYSGLCPLIYVVYTV